MLIALVVVTCSVIEELLIKWRDYRLRREAREAADRWILCWSDELICER